MSVEETMEGVPSPLRESRFRLLPKLHQKPKNNMSREDLQRTVVFLEKLFQKEDQNVLDPRGILICGSGQGMAIAANRQKGIRAGLGWSVIAAKSTRNDEDSNLLALPSEILKNESDWKEVIVAWLETPFAGAPIFRRRNRHLDEI